jgi:ESS family glutamate:Na+ symporter
MAQMGPTFPFETMLVAAGLGVCMLIGVMLRARVGFFQRYLIPSCLIGGIVAMILRNAEIITMNVALLETAVYHLFNISFISIGLTPMAKPLLTTGRREKVEGALGMGLLQGVIFPLQALIGGGLTILLISLGFDVFPTFGFFSPLGFIEGPGQALSLGESWEEIAAETYAHATTVGLTFATAGFFFAFFVGVPLVYWGIKKGLAREASPDISPVFRSGIAKRGQIDEMVGKHTMHPANIDSLSFHAALVGLCFAITYGLIYALTDNVGEDLAKTIWGFFFFFGMVVALFVRYVMEKLGADFLIDRELQKRVTGVSVDFLILTTVAAIEVSIVWEFLVPLSIIALATGLLTTLVEPYLGKRIWSEYGFERTAGIYGTVTGTVPSGLLLVRIADPHFETPAAFDLGIMNLFAAPFILVGMILVNAPVLWGWSLELTLLVFAVLMTFSLLLFRVFKVWGKPQF